MCFYCENNQVLLQYYLEGITPRLMYWLDNIVDLAQKRPMNFDGGFFPTFLLI